ncbi:MAG: site-specific DNA-methyltransferase [Acidobacteriia bacterium]|nr:site-specific DNA-methyltransferase [Terriglobia bacterium]
MKRQGSSVDRSQVLRHSIYAIDNHNLSLLPENSVQLTVTSPPYVTTEFRRGQDFPYEQFLEDFHAVCEQLYRVTVPGGRFALNVADIITKYRYADDKTISRVPLGSDTLQVAQKAGFRLLERFIWDKGYTRNFGGPLLGSYPFPLTIFNNNYFEYIYVLQKPGKRHVLQKVRESSRLTPEEWRDWTQRWWRVESISEKLDYHGAVFPVEIPYRIIRMYSYVGDTVLDPYIGTGSTMFAAHKAGRQSIGFEIDPECRRWIRQRMHREIRPLLEAPLEYEILTEVKHAS